MKKVVWFKKKKDYLSNLLLNYFLTYSYYSFTIDNNFYNTCLVPSSMMGIMEGTLNLKLKTGEENVIIHGNRAMGTGGKLTKLCETRVLVTRALWGQNMPLIKNFRSDSQRRHRIHSYPCGQWKVRRGWLFYVLFYVLFF